MLEPLIRAGKQADREFQVSRAVTQAAHSALGRVKRECIVWATKARDALRPFLGSGGWNVGYASAGFTSPSLAIPQTVTGLADLIPALTAHFQQFPKRQQPEAGVTAVIGAQLAQKIEEADNALAAAEVDQRTKRDAREAAEKVLAEKVATLLKELDTALKPTDPRWLDFIGDIPGDPQRPEVVENLAVTGATPGELDVTWEGGLRAERYQLEVLVVGQDTDFRRVETVKDENATLSGLPTGAQVQVRVTGANKVGEGPACEPVSVQGPGLAAAA